MRDQSASWCVIALVLVSACLYGMASQGTKDAVLLFGGLLVAAPFALALGMLAWHGVAALLEG